jgi:acyl-CoA synthetase (AMP-forming)/AMP-acid ligase II
MWLHYEIRNLGDIPRHWARVTPDRPALIDGLGRRTWRGLEETSNRIASAVVASGIAPRSHIGFFGKNSASYF